MGQIEEYFKIALRNLRTRSLRSWLTVLGIVIGIFLIISLLSLSEGINKAISEQIQALGGDMIMVMPGGDNLMMSMMMGGDDLEKEDIKAIERTKGVDVVLPMSYRGIIVRHEGESKFALLAGISFKDEFMDILKKFQGWSLAEGEWPRVGRKELLIGQQVSNAIFKEEVKIGDQLTIKGKRIKVVGVLNSLGNKSDDSQIYLDMDDYYDITGEKRGSAKMVMVKIKEGAPLDGTARNIKEDLGKVRKRRVGSDEDDFSVITAEKIGEITGSIVGIIQFAIIIFAGIAVLVGGIGITNTMFTSVRDRTREIGIMKAIGAKNSAILKIFLIESGIIGLIGGIGGTILGLFLAKVVESYGQAHPVFYISASFNPNLILFGIGFSFFVGCISGFFPALRAAKMKPVEALRRFE